MSSVLIGNRSKIQIRFEFVIFTMQKFEAIFFRVMAQLKKTDSRTVHKANLFKNNLLAIWIISSIVRWLNDGVFSFF